MMNKSKTGKNAELEGYHFSSRAPFADDFLQYG